MSDLEDLPEDGGQEHGRARLRKSPTAFRTISEVADELHIPQHVLRFWETKFPQVKPLKRGGGRRYYRPDDLALLKRISDLLYIQGYTIKGVQRLLREGPGRLGASGEGAEDMTGDALEGEIDLAELPDERAEGMGAGDEPEATRGYSRGAAHDARDPEAERLRAVLRETLAMLEALRATLD